MSSPSRSFESTNHCEGDATATNELAGKRPATPADEAGSNAVVARTNTDRSNKTRVSQSPGPRGLASTVGHVTALLIAFAVWHSIGGIAGLIVALFATAFIELTVLVLLAAITAPFQPRSTEITTQASVLSATGGNQMTNDGAEEIEAAYRTPGIVCANAGGPPHTIPSSLKRTTKAVLVCLAVVLVVDLSQWALVVFGLLNSCRHAEVVCHAMWLIHILAGSLPLIGFFLVLHRRQQ